MHEFADMLNIWEHQQHLDELVAMDCITCEVFGIDDAIIAAIITSVASGASSGAGAAAKAQGRNVQAAKAKGKELAQQTAQTQQEIESPTGRALNPIIEETSPLSLEDAIRRQRKDEMFGQGLY